MYISEIRIKNFKKFENAKFMFDHGINVIKGANEQGKSTLLKAIVASLFVDPSSAKYRDLFKSWNANTLPELELDFFVDENLYAITKNFNTKEVVLKDVINQKEEKNYAVIMQKVKEYIGVGNETLLRMTACISQDEMALMESGKKSLHEALQDITLNKDKVDVLQLLKEIQAKIDEMQVGLYHPAKYNGVIKRVQDEITERQQELEKLQHTETSLNDASDKLKSLLNEEKEVNDQIIKYTKIVQDYEAKDSVQKELDSVEAQIKNNAADLNKIKELREKVQTAEQKLNTLGGTAILQKMDEHYQDILELNRKVKELEDEASKRHQEVQPVVVEEKKSYGLMYFITSIIALILVISGIFLGKALIFIGLGVVLVNMVLVFFVKETESHHPEIREVEVQPVGSELDEVKERMGGMLQECQVQTYEEYFSKRTQLIALHSDYTQTKSTIDALLRGKSENELDESLTDLTAKKRELEMQLPQGEIVSKEEYMRDKRELELLNLDKKDITAEVAEEKAKIKVTEVTPEEIRAKEAKLKELKEQLAENKHHLEVLQAIAEALTKAKDDITKQVSSNIETYVQKSLPVITDGRYTSLQMDSDFHIKVFAKERGEWIDPQQHLSKGTIDQIYLSARLALADIITQGKVVPLFFDDPFLTFDEKRRNALLDELTKIAQARQIFIFTCHDFFDGCGRLIPIQE